MMDRRIGLRIGGALAVVTCALLVACGGGGGGGSTIPSTGGGGTVTPTPTPVPAAQTASATTSTSAATTITLGAIANGPTQTVVAFPSTTTSTTASVTAQTSLPSAAGTVPQAKSMAHPMTLGSTPTVLAYYVVQVSSAVSISSAPGFTATLPSALGAGFADVVYYSGSTNGWVSLEEIPVTAGATSLNFPPATLSPAVSLAANTPYVFALVTSSKSLATPTPVPTNTPTTAPTATPTASGPTPSPGTAATLPPPSSTAAQHGWSAYDVATAFQFPVQSGYNGQGQTIAIVGDEVPSSVDTQTYLSAYGIVSPIYSGTFSTVPVDGGSVPGSDSAGLGEATLDVETVMGLAPGAHVLFYAIPDLSDISFVDAYNKIKTDGQANIVSLSFGGCESYQGVNYTTSDTGPLAALANAGVAVVASSGDQGNECYTGAASPAPQFSPGANYPASDPSVIGVGGTQTDASISSTLAWHDSVGSTGGAISGLFTIPAAQQNLGFSSSTQRNVPDMSLPAVAVAVRLGNLWQQFDGTSWSAPQTAALLSEIFEYCGGPLPTSFTSPQDIFYKAYGRATSDFSDVVTGNNQWQASTPFYTATTGPDNTSGLGLPLGMPIANSLCPNHVPQLQRASAAAILMQGYGPSTDVALNNAPHVPGVRDLGARDGSAQTRIALVLRSNGTLGSDLQSVASKLRSAGFTVESARGMVIDASAPASVVAGYFRTSLHDFAQGGAGTRYANVTGVTIPAAIAPYVSGVIADNLIVARHFLHPHVR